MQGHKLQASHPKRIKKLAFAVVHALRGWPRPQRAPSPARKTSRTIAWWEFESQLKRQLALELLLRRMFAQIPTPA